MASNGLQKFFRPGPGIGALIVVLILWLFVDPVYELSGLLRIAAIVAGGVVGWLVSGFLTKRSAGAGGKNNGV